MKNRALILFSSLATLCLLNVLGSSCIKKYPNPHQPPPAEKSIAEKHPHDEGIATDPNVLYAENFEEALPNVISQYQDVLNTEGMSLDADIPAGSSGKNSLKITNIGGQNTGGHLFKSFEPGFDSVTYIRYYVKYPASSKGYIHHEGVWVGGYNPMLTYPYPRAGICGLDERLSIAYEPSNDSTMGTYNYWTGMKSWNGGTSCYGNDMLHQSPVPHPLIYDRWMCVELRIKLNSPATASNGELTVWHDGVKVGEWGPGFPNGHWAKDTWITDPSEPPFEGFRWRANEDLRINYIWIEFYDDASPNNVSHHINYDNLVVAKKYIGPIKN